MDNIVKDLINWINAGMSIKIEFQFSEKGYSLYSMQGAKTTKEDVLGNFEAEYQFEITFRSKPTNSQHRIDAGKKVDDVGKWLSSQEEYFDDDVIEIEQTSFASMVYRSDDGTEDYQASFRMKYEGVRNG